jgi:hypothetical protein
MQLWVFKIDFRNSQPGPGVGPLGFEISSLKGMSSEI